MMTYALFETVEILKFCFFMFDKDKNGFIHKVRTLLCMSLLSANFTLSFKFFIQFCLTHFPLCCLG